MILLSSACNSEPDGESEFRGLENEIQLMALNPGHFHAALVQKEMLHQVDPTVYIFAPEGDDLDLHIERIEGFNQREENPTEWSLEVYTGQDYFDELINNRPGNVMITAGNNRLKTDYIHRAVGEGIHVLSDKPMAIDSEGWEKLTDAFQIAEENNVLLYDIMTERNEVTSRIQRKFAQNRELFGQLEKGSPEHPAIIKESIHHLYKTVGGQPLRRPPWYFDVTQQGEGIVDVTTHLVDLSLWGTFPDQAIDHNNDVEMITAERWPTIITQEQFETITGQPEFPDYLSNQLINGELPYYSNGDIKFKLRGHHVYISVQWNYEAPKGGNDTHYSEMRGTRSNLVIRQGEEQDFTSTLYIKPTDEDRIQEIENALETMVEELQSEFPGISFIPSENGWQLQIPDQFYLGHEAHFSKVAENYLEYLVDGELPEWEVPNMITKYNITTQARELAMDE